ncbi:hypothetical protein, partial [Jeotgalibaca porci]|uniref:hypothetical protein n=1 Tax=Jeotgalibaca porci TaxID=1868793 RepID=UPI00359FCF3F
VIKELVPILMTMRLLFCSFFRIFISIPHLILITLLNTITKSSKLEVSERVEVKKEAGLASEPLVGVISLYSYIAV